MKQKYKKGLAFGVFDIFHIGHLRYLQFASDRCKELYVGIRSDDLVTPGKNRKAYFNENIRLEVIQSLQCVKEAFVFRIILDDTKYWINYLQENEINILFIGMDWKNSNRWQKLEPLLNDINIKVFYVDRTENISSSKILIKNKKKRHTKYTKIKN